MPSELELMFARFKRNSTPDKTTVARPVTQHLLYPGSAAYTPFAWTANFELEDRPTEVRVVVKILTTAAETVRAKWSTHIGSFWNNKASLHVRGAHSPTPSIGKNIVFQITWVTAQTVPPTAYSVQHQAVPKVPKTWKEIQAEYDTHRDHTIHGTPHMGLWGEDDTEAISHEFGHMLGLPDEYYTYFLDYVALPTSYNAVPFTTDSIMNSTGPTGKLHERHFFTVVDEYKKWKGIADGDIGIKMGSAEEQRKSPWA